jgi:hypothetical protein
MRAWARDALALALPTQIVCREDCAGLCAVCGENLNRSPDHAHEREPDPRWAALARAEARLTAWRASASRSPRRSSMTCASPARDSLARARDGGDWSQGVPLAYLRELCDHWAGEYDWRATETRLNALRQFRTEIDGLGIHFVHVRSPTPDAIPLVLPMAGRARSSSS